MLVPLYLLIRDDLHLPGVKWAAAIVTVYGMVYAILSYPAGVMADRVSRKRMLGWGLVLNAVVIAGMGLTRSYETLIVLAVFAGIAGTFFHPAANALVPEHFPRSPGMAIGLLGMGSGLGFFAGPQYAGWRAQAAHWKWHSIANWQRPCVELGLAGLVAGILFLLLAREARPAPLAGTESKTVHPPLGKQLRWRISSIAAILACRDFAGVASISLTSIYLQKAMRINLKDTGLIIGTMMLTGVISNPLAVWLTPGRWRLRGLTVVLIAAGAAIACVPFFRTRASVLAILCVFQGFQLGSYAITDAGILERIPANVRGRVVGLFLTIAGTFAGTGPWVMGTWTDWMGLNAARPLAYQAPFATLGAMMLISSLVAPLIDKLGKPVGEGIHPLTEIVPGTLETVA